MKIFEAILLFAACQLCVAGEETNIIAISDWSKPVTSHYDTVLRARVIIEQVHSPASSDPALDTEKYLELQNVTPAMGRPMHIYFFPWEGLKCQMLDVNGKPLARQFSAWSGPMAASEANWITLPYNSWIRLRVSAAGEGIAKGEGLKLVLSPGVTFDILKGDTNDYYLSGTFTVTTPTNYVPKDPNESLGIWAGTLELPKVKIPGGNP